MDFSTKEQLAKQRKTKKVRNDPTERAKEKLKRHFQLDFYHLPCEIIVVILFLHCKKYC